MIMKNKLYLFYFLIIKLLVSSCTNVTINSIISEKRTIKKGSIKNYQSCIKFSDSLKVNEFVVNYINHIYSNDLIALSEKNSYPLKFIGSKVDSKEEFLLKFKNSKFNLNSIFNIEVFNEKDILIDSISSKNTEILYKDDLKNKNCKEVFIGFKTGLYLKINKSNSKYKIMVIDFAG